MPNFHKRNLFTDALYEVKKNDAIISETYRNVKNAKPNLHPQQLNEVIGEILGGLAAGAMMVAPTIAKAMGAREEKKRYERERAHIEAEPQRAREQELEVLRRRFGQETSERIGRETFESGESEKRRNFEAGESEKRRGFEAGESEKQRGFTKGESLKQRRFTRDERLGGEDFRKREERKRAAEAMLRAGLLAGARLDAANILSGLGKNKGKNSGKSGKKKGKKSGKRGSGKKP